jgi:hypothetical protein
MGNLREDGNECHDMQQQEIYECDVYTAWDFVQAGASILVLGDELEDPMVHMCVTLSIHEQDC